MADKVNTPAEPSGSGEGIPASTTGQAAGTSVQPPMPQGDSAQALEAAQTDLRTEREKYANLRRLYNQKEQEWQKTASQPVKPALPAQPDYGPSTQAFSDGDGQVAQAIVEAADERAHDVSAGLRGEERLGH